MRVLFDVASLQVRAHGIAGGENRLQRLVEGLASELKAEVLPRHFPDRPVPEGQVVPLSEQGLSSADVLVIPTRGPRYPYAPGDPTLIEEFVRSGKGLLILANHADRGRLPNLAKQDAEVAGLFGLTIEETVVEASGGGLLTMSVAELDHPILKGPSVVKSIVVNNCTSLLDTNADGLVPLPPNAVDTRQGSRLDNKFVFIARTWGEGRVVVGGDSGLCGNAETCFPGPGLIDRADNLALLINSIAWLGKQTG